MESACNDIELLNILSIFKSLIGLITILVPVILGIFVIIDIIKTISSSEVESKKLTKSISTRIIAAVLIFLIPSLLNFVIGLIPMGNLYYIDCYNSATKENVANISEQNAINSLSNLSSFVTNLENNKNKSNYDAAMLAYEKARKDVKLITDKAIKEEKQEELKNYKSRIDANKP